MRFSTEDKVKLFDTIMEVKTSGMYVILTDYTNSEQFLTFIPNYAIKLSVDKMADEILGSWFVKDDYVVHNRGKELKLRHMMIGRMLSAVGESYWTGDDYETVKKYCFEHKIRNEFEDY